MARIFAQIRDDRGGFGDDHDVVRSAHSSAGLGVLTTSCSKRPRPSLAIKSAGAPSLPGLGRR